MVAISQVIVALTPWLGSDLTRRLEAETAEITHLLNAWSPRQDLADVHGRIDSLLFRAVRFHTGGTLVIPLDDGSRVRVTLEDFSAMADDAMYPLFCDLPADAEHLTVLREYSMRAPGLSALKAMYLRFAPLQTEEELNAIATFVKKCYPAFRWRGWL